MKKGFLLLFVFALSVSVQAQTSDLIGMLVNEMGITNEQAEGGAGSLFNFAQEGMSESDFGDLSDAVPGMDDLLGAVPSLGGKSSLMGKAASAVTGMPAVVKAFDKLGLSESQVAIMTPLLVNYVEKKGGAKLAKLFGNSVGAK
jgi:hypothetical protein